MVSFMMRNDINIALVAMTANAHRIPDNGSAISHNSTAYAAYNGSGHSITGNSSEFTSLSNHSEYQKPQIYDEQVDHINQVRFRR